jgi:hypothetical protein
MPNNSPIKTQNTTIDFPVKKRISILIINRIEDMEECQERQYNYRILTKKTRKGILAVVLVQ